MTRKRLGSGMVALLMAASVFARGAEPLDRDALDKGCRVLTDGKGLVATVMDPESGAGLLAGRRFCPLAVVVQVALEGQEFFYLPTPYLPAEASPGLVTEFDNDTPPPGYLEAQPDGPFVKVGVGALRRVPSSTGQLKYTFTDPYPVVALAQSRAEWSADRAVFRQDFPAVDGYGYELTAAVRVAGPRLTVDWTLKNTGEKRFRTVQYVHNSFSFSTAGASGGGIGPEYSLSLPSALNAFASRKGWWLTQLNSPTPQPEQHYTFYDGVLRPVRRMETFGNVIFTSRPDADRTQPWTLRRAGGPAVKFRTVPEPLAQSMVHGSPNYLCPEQFILLETAPGEETRWRREYEFFPRGLP